MSDELREALQAPERASQEKWDLRFLRMARLVASWSKDPSTKVGAVVVRPDKTVASLGFNGFPRGVDDDPKNYEDREEKYGRVVHAEVNAVLHAHERLDGCTLYVWPPALGPTCDRCAAVVIQAGIKEVVYVQDLSLDFNLRWGDALLRAKKMYAEAGVLERHYMQPLGSGF